MSSSFGWGILASSSLVIGALTTGQLKDGEITLEGEQLNFVGGEFAVVDLDVIDLAGK